MQNVEIKNVKPLLQQHTVSGSTDWNGWLSEFETNLKELGTESMFRIIKMKISVTGKHLKTVKMNFTK